VRVATMSIPPRELVAGGILHESAAEYPLASTVALTGPGGAYSDCKS
jgi:hypothetical protein